MRHAGRASGRAFTEAMRQSWTTEKDLNAFLEYTFKRNGCDTSAYVPVVAGGKNARQIHYVRNDDVLHDGDVVVADAGGVNSFPPSSPIITSLTTFPEESSHAILSNRSTATT